MKALRKTIFISLVLSLLSLPLKAQEHSTAKQHGSQEHVMLNQEKFDWKDGPVSLPKGARVAVIEGDPSQEGPFTMRIMLPANYRIPPHWHPAIEHVTVLKGSLYMGTGEKMDMDSATKLSVGGFAVMPVKFVHFAFTREEATIQLHGIGPWNIVYVNPKDDPRQAR